MNFHQKPWRPEENGTSLKCCKEKKNYQHRISYPVKIFFKDNGKIKTISDKRKLRIHCQQIYTVRMLREVPQLKGKDSRWKSRSSEKDEEHQKCFLKSWRNEKDYSSLNLKNKSVKCKKYDIDLWDL